MSGSMEKIYIISSPHFRGVNIGCWKGSIADLHVYLSEFFFEMDIIAFACTNSRSVKQLLHRTLRRYHGGGNVYKLEVMPHFLKICSVVCDDSIPCESC